MKPWCLVLAALVGWMPQEKDNLADATRRISRSSNYGFTLRQKNETIPGREPALSLTGHWQRNEPLHWKGSGVEVYRRTDVLVYLTDKEWKKYDPNAGVTAAEQGRRRILEKVRRLRPPHEELAALRKNMKKARKVESEKKGSPSFEGTLDATGAADILNNGQNAPMPGYKSDLEGRVAFWTDDEGTLTRYEIRLTWRERHRHHEGVSDSEVVWKKTVEIRDIDKAGIDIPKAAREALDTDR